MTKTPNTCIEFYGTLGIKSTLNLEFSYLHVLVYTKFGVDLRLFFTSKKLPRFTLDLDVPLSFRLAFGLKWEVLPKFPMNVNNVC